MDATDKKVEEIDIDALFNEETSEETREKVKAVFEAAVLSKAEELIEDAIDEIEEAAEAYGEYVAGELEEATDEYMSYVAEKWLEENALAVESSLKVELAESLIDGIADLMAEHNLEVPEGADDVVEGILSRNDELAEQLNEALKRNMALEEAIELAQVESTVDRLTEGLTDTQATKIRHLAEDIKFSDADDFAGKLTAIRESFFRGDLEVEDPTVDRTGPITESKKEAASDVSEIVKQINARF